MPQEAAHGQTQTKTASLCTSSSTATKLSPHEEATPNVRRMARRLGPPPVRLGLVSAASENMVVRGLHDHAL